MTLLLWFSEGTTNTVTAVDSLIWAQWGNYGGQSEGSREDSALWERSTAELLRQLSEQTTTLVRQELDLAKAELTVKGKRGSLGASMPAVLAWAGYMRSAR